MKRFTFDILPVSQIKKMVAAREKQKGKDAQPAPKFNPRDKSPKPKGRNEYV